MSPQDNNGIQVIIPYKQLEDLLQASLELKQLRVEVKRQREQLSALRLQFTELMELLRDT